MAEANRLLIVDDEPDVRAFFRDVAEDLDYEVAEAGNYADFAAAYVDMEPTAILVDLTMPEVDGVEILRDLARRVCRSAVLLASGQDSRVLMTAQRLGRSLGLNMHAAFQKPVSVAEIEEALLAVRSLADGDFKPGGLVCGARPSDVTARALLEAIESDELILHYQPKVDLQQGDSFPIIGSEALVRWMHPDHGLLPPSLFVGLAEETDLIAPMTEAIVRKAIAQLAEWNKDGIALPVSVNLSPKQLTDLTLPDRITEELNRYDLDPSLLVIEITEQAAMADIGKATEILTRMRLKNFAVALDDFGAGYSSLVEIYRLPLSELKFDRSLIVDLDFDPDARTVVRALAGLARALDLSVCAEGIETAETAAFLQDVGIDKAQGYYFGMPLPAEQLTDLVKGGGVTVAGHPAAPALASG